MNAIRYVSSSSSSSEPESAVAATHVGFIPPSARSDYVANVDRRMEATLGLAKDVSATLRCDLSVPPRFGLVPTIPKIGMRVDGEVGRVEMYNFVLPTLYHYIEVKIHGGHGRVEKVYRGKEGMKGKEWWSTYRHQLEAMVDRIRGRETETWVSREESVATMECIERVYEKVCDLVIYRRRETDSQRLQSGLGSRPKSSYVP